MISCLHEFKKAIKEIWISFKIKAQNRDYKFTVRQNMHFRLDLWHHRGQNHVITDYVYQFFIGFSGSQADQKSRDPRYAKQKHRKVHVVEIF